MTRVLLIGVLLAVVAWGFWRLIDGVIAAFGGLPEGRRGSRPPAVKLARDPVCGTFVSPREAISLTTRGNTHYFCSEDCRAKYRKGA